MDGIQRTLRDTSHPFGSEKNLASGHDSRGEGFSIRCGGIPATRGDPVGFRFVLPAHFGGEEFGDQFLIVGAQRLGIRFLMALGVEIVRIERVHVFQMGAILVV